VLRKLICSAHTKGINVEAVYTNKDHFDSALNYNNTGTGWTLCIGKDPDAVLPFKIFNKRFDAIRMDYEPDEFLGVGPTTQDHIQYYKDAKDAAGSLDLFVSIGYRWNALIDGRPAYEHIIDAVNGVDVQVAWGSLTADPPHHRGANVIADRIDPIAKYANDHLDLKKVWATTYVHDMVTSEVVKQAADEKPAPNAEDLKVLERQTFHAEGEEAMFYELGAVGVSPFLSANLDGFMYHFYRHSYGGGFPWPRHDAPDDPVFTPPP
jgi:hypothetical protein